ncbi:MAG: hypothetical protein HRT45_06095 [Bdellovibrionales bacterium]|nr:hypothetical protein [Bdellovibrionales bacterium]
MSNPSSCMALGRAFVVLLFIISTSAEALTCKFELRSTRQTEAVRTRQPKLITSNWLSTLFSSRRYNGLVRNASGPASLLMNVESALKTNSINTTYAFTRGGWDDRGMSMFLDSANTHSHKMGNGLSLYLFKTSNGAVHLYAEIENEMSGSVEIHAVGNGQFRRSMKKWEREKSRRLSDVDTAIEGRVVDIDDYGTEGAVELVNEFLMAYDQMSGWSFSNANRIDIVKTAYRYALDLKRQDKLDLDIDKGEHIQLAIEKVKELNGASWITPDNATDLAYEMMTLGISVDVMTKIYRLATRRVGGDRMYYMLFLNSMLGHIKIRNMQGENIQINESNYEAIFSEYEAKYNKAEDLVGFWSGACAPFLFSYSLLKGGDFDANLETGRAAVGVIHDVGISKKIAGAILLVTLSLKVDEDLGRVKTLAENAKAVYRRTRNDEGGSILLAEVMEREGATVDQMRDQSRFMWDQIRIANEKTIGEAIYLSRRIPFTLGETRLAMNELDDRVYRTTSVEAQDVIDLLEILRIRRQLYGIGSGSGSIEDEGADDTKDTAIDLVEEIIEETTDTILMTVIIITVINS